MIVNQFNLILNFYMFFFFFEYYYYRLDKHFGKIFHIYVYSLYLRLKFYERLNEAIL